MDVHAISKSVISFFVLMGLIVIFIMGSGFSMNPQLFTLLLLGILIAVSFYSGRAAEAYPTLNGFMVGMISVVVMLFFLSGYVDMHWELNFMLIVLFGTSGLMGSYIGSKTVKKSYA